MPKSKQRSDGLYEYKAVIGRDKDGRAIRKSFYGASKGEAMKKAALYDGSVEAKKNTPEMTVKDWSEYCLATYKKGKVRESSYVSSYERPARLYIYPALGYMKIGDVKPIDIQNLINKVQNEFSVTYTKKVAYCLSVIFKHAYINGVIESNPCTYMPSIKPTEESTKRFYTQEQVNKLLAYSDAHPNGMMIRLFLTLGLRRSELSALTWNDINFKERTISINKAVTEVKGKIVVDKPKSAHSTRVLPISKGLCRRLEEWHTVCNKRIKSLAEQPKLPKELKAGLIISRKDGNVINPCHFSNEYEPFFADFIRDTGETDFPLLTPHELRHTCGTLLYQRTKDIYAVSRYLGHSSVEMTAKIYVHSTTDALRESLHIEDFE